MRMYPNQMFLILSAFIVSSIMFLSAYLGALTHDMLPWLNRRVRRHIVKSKRL